MHFCASCSYGTSFLLVGSLQDWARMWYTMFGGRCTGWEIWYCGGLLGLLGGLRGME